MMQPPEPGIEVEDPTGDGLRLSDDGDLEFPDDGLGLEGLDLSGMTNAVSLEAEHGTGDADFGSRHFKIPLASF
jgi:hypothetical protein